MKNAWTIGSDLLLRATLASAALLAGMEVGDAGAQTLDNGVFRLAVAPSTAQNRRNSESDIIPLRDEGKTWEHVKNVAHAADDSFAYPSVAIVGDRALLTYFNYRGGISLWLQGIPVRWFYE